MKPPEHEIIFRRVTDDLPSCWSAPPPNQPQAGHWYVEYHDLGWDVAPAGIAFVEAFHEWREALIFIFVVDHMRRQGIATALVRACRERWPDLWVSNLAISEAGEGLALSLGISDVELQIFNASEEGGAEKKQLNSAGDRG